MKGTEAVGKAAIVAATLLGGLGLFASAARIWWNHSPGMEQHPHYAIDIACPPGESFGSGDELVVGVSASNITPAVPDSFVDLDGDGRFSIGIDTWLDRNRNRRFDAVWLAGERNGRPAGGVGDSLYATAVVIGNTRCRIAICSVDAFGIFYDDVVAIRSRVSAMLSGSRDSLHYVAIVATGTRGAPDLIGLWGKNEEETGRDPTYAGRVRRGAADAIVRAARGARTAKAEAPTPRPGRESISFRNAAGTLIAMISFEGMETRRDIASSVLVSSRLRGNQIPAEAVGVGGDGFPMVVHLPIVRSGPTEGHGEIPRVSPAGPPFPLSVRAKTVFVPLGSGTMRTAANLGLIERGFNDGNLRTEIGVVTLGELELVFIPGVPGAREAESLRKQGGDGHGTRTRYLVARANDFLGELAGHAARAKKGAGPEISIGLEGRRALLQKTRDLADSG